MSLWTGLMGHDFVMEQVSAGGVSTRSMRMGAGALLIFLLGITGHLEAFAPTEPLHADELIDVRYKIYHKQDFRDAVDGILKVAEPDPYTANMLSPELPARITGEALFLAA